jgi:Flp pilus assembly protein TadD
MNLVGRTPLDCFTCVLIRGRIDATAKRWHAAAFWFARSERLAPSLPDAPLEWSKMLLEKGDASGAASKAAAASRIAPHYADALEVWGEALMRENRSDLAAEKFSAAAKFAPNWGRLHLEWGEALSYSGTPDEARAQYAIASGLYLEPAERSRLRQLQAH